MAQPISMFFVQAAIDHAKDARDFAGKLEGYEGEQLNEALSDIIDNLATSVEALANIVTELGRAVGAGEIGGGTEYAEA